MQQRPRSPATRSQRRVALTETDLELLRFLAEHRFVLSDHAAALGRVTPQTANRRLARLVESGYARREPGFSGQSHLHLITHAGLRALGSALPTPRRDLQNYEHDVGLAWLWLAARNGAFGPLSEVLSERTLRSREGRRAEDAEHFAVRLGGHGPGGRDGVHYPDLLLTTTDGRRVALELELSPKERTRLETILAGYGADPRIAGVVYLVQSHSIARSVERAARKVGVSELVHLQRVRSQAPGAPAARAAAIDRTAAVSRGATEAAR